MYASHCQTRSIKGRAVGIRVSIRPGEVKKLVWRSWYTGAYGDLWTEGTVD